MAEDERRVFTSALPFGARASFCGVPTAAYGELDPRQVAVLGAPVDWGTSYRPGARFGPAAVREGDYLGPDGLRPALPYGIDCAEVLRLRDLGDADVVRGYMEPTLERIEATVAQIVGRGAIPVIIGGEHTITLANVRGVAQHLGTKRFALLHFDAHADLGEYPDPQTYGHGMPMRNLLDGGIVAPTQLYQFGLRGYWPGPEGLQWMRERGVVAHFAEDLDRAGMDAALAAAIGRIHGENDGRAFVSVDIDALDPAYAPGTGTPEPGGLSASLMLRTLRRIGRECEVVGADLVEVAPVYDQPANGTAVLGNRLLLALLTGMALRRRDG
jgi:agmatinase